MDESVGQKLLVEEYKSCRDLIQTNIEIIEKSEVYAVGAVGAIAVFSLSSSVEMVAKVTSWIPLIIACLGIVRFYGVDSTIDKINNYLVTVEASHPEINWTTFYREHNKRKILKSTRYAIWIILIGLGIGLGVLTLCKGPFGPPPSAQSQK
jgi:hypothetical protein